VSAYEPLRVSCYAFGEIVTDGTGTLPLDGVLAHLWMREYHPDILYHDSVRAKDELIEADLPIRRIDNGHGWYYACSFAQVEWVGGSTHHWHKRAPILAMTRYVGEGKVNVAEGAFRSYRMPLFTLLAGSRLYWYLVGDVEWIAYRLPLVTCLGKKRTMGFGVVCDWQVEVTDDDWSVWGPEGQLMRAIPIEDVPTDRPIDFAIRESYAIRPPAWHPANQVKAAMP